MPVPRVEKELSVMHYSNTLYNMDISKTDICTLIRYLTDASRVYDSLPGQKNVMRRDMLNRMKDKLQKKITT